MSGGLGRIRESPSAARLLCELCDFEPISEETPGWFALESGGPLQVIARDGAGGRFCLCGAADVESQPVLYVSSEGQAGTIAGSLSEALQMMIALPYWRDCLKFSRGGDIQEMRRAQAYFEAELRRQRDMRGCRWRLYQACSVDTPLAPLEGLHRAVVEGKAVVVAPSDGTRFEGLFGTSVVPERSE